MHPVPRVLVVGGGPAGLLTAHALQKHGARVTVYEQDASLDARPRDWNFGIYWAQAPLKECLPEDLVDEVENCQVDDKRAGADATIRVVNAETEELIQALPTPHIIRLARRRFLRLISQGLDIQYGKRLLDISSDGRNATVTFEDGITVTGDLLIGADGAHSKVRDFLLGPEKAAVRELPLVANFTVATLPAEAVETFRQFSDRFLLSFHPKGMFNWIGLHNARGDPESGDWEFMMIQSWREDLGYDPRTMDGSDQVLAAMKKRSDLCGDRTRSIWKSIPEGTRCWHSRVTDWMPEPWNNRSGTVTLVGDAAHALTFHRGQGLNNSVLDAGLLAECAKKHGFTKAAIDAYEQDMIPRAREAVISSTQNSLDVHDWDKLLLSPLFKLGVKPK